MKKLGYLGLVMVLLAFSVVPVFAASPNGHGNGVSTGQGNSNQDQNGQQNRGLGIGRGHSKINTSEKGKNENPGNRMRTPFYLQGTIISTDTMTMTLTISVTHGNAQVKQFIGNDLTVKASNTTKIFKLTQGEETETETDITASEASSTSSTDDETPGNKVAITFGQLAAGDKVAVHGNVVGGVYEATSITVYVNSAQTGIAQAHPSGLAQILPNTLGFLHGLSLKIGKLVINLP